MDRLLARLERSILGRFAIERLTTFIVGGMALVFFLSMARPEMLDRITLDSRAVSEPWRFVTFLFIPPSQRLIWVIFALYWTWLIGTNLEQEWGAFKLNVYYLIGAIGTTAAAWITKEPQGNFWLNTSLFFAFATIFPNYEILAFFIIPIRVKWLALLSLGLVIWSAVTGDWGVRLAITVALSNYLLFFAGHLVSLARGQQLQMKQAARRSSLRASSVPPARDARDEPTAGGRVCAICGAKQADGADIRVCSCEKCGGGPRDLCLAHARNH